MRYILSTACVALHLVLAGPAAFAQSAAEDGTPPAFEAASEFGIGYSRYEPAFYTGFAPRIQQPDHLHIHIGRGNQVRITAVLSDRTLETYADDLQARLDTYRSAIASGEITLTQNDGYALFDATLADVGLSKLVADDTSLSDDDVRARNLNLMERLNPGRVFRIQMPIDDVIAQWSNTVRSADAIVLLEQRILVNAMLPTRLYVRDLSRQAQTAATALIARARKGDTPQAMRADFVALLNQVAPGRYPLMGDRLEFAEFTAIYPIGSFNEYVMHKGRKIPLYPTPGRRALMIHQRTKTPDHIPTNLVYSYAPWLPYMHVGTRLHNSFHTLWWQMTPDDASFLPDAFKDSGRANREGGTHKFLWILSRGPMSHGCTHVNLGHILELRQLLPSETQDMFNVEVFINTSHLFDVFDIDGDLEPEVMGVEYYVAYSLRNKRPHALRAAAERTAYYEWLYGGELHYDAHGIGYFENVRDARFTGPRAQDGDLYPRITLYEAELEPQRYQFFAPKPIAFIRDLRKAGIAEPTSG